MVRGFQRRRSAAPLTQTHAAAYTVDYEKAVTETSTPVEPSSESGGPSWKDRVRADTVAPAENPS